MRKLILTTVFLVLPAGLLAAGGEESFAAVSASEAERFATLSYDTTAAMYIWADKYVYQPGEQLTLRWTVKANNDLYPYTIVAYRVNNQTGVKTYLPGGSAAASDIFGRSLADGFRAVRLTDAAKQVLVGAGGVVVSSPATIPNELGMHTLTVELRDYSGGRVIKTAYFKIGVVDGFDTISGNIETSRRLVNTRGYRLSGTVFVRNGAVLTIDPGTFIIGNPGSLPPSALVITQNGRIEANGTRSRPIVMTSSQPFGQRQRGDWGGLVLLGKGRTNWPTGFGEIEGLLPGAVDAQYGGTDENHNCGTLRYVRVEFAGALVRPNDELNAITWGGCGRATVSEYLQSTYGQDDAFEWFGGNNDGKYLVASYAKDDYFDWQIGYTGRIQHALGYVAATVGSNRGFEGDNNERDFALQPRSRPQFYNITLVGNPASPDDENNSIAGIWVRRGTGGAINNTLVYNWNQTGIEIRDADTATAITNNELTVDGLALWDNGRNLNPAKPNTVAGQTNSANTPAAVAAPLLELLQGTRGTGRNVLVADPMLRRPLEYSDPDFRPMPGSPLLRAGWVQPPDNGFFDQWANYIGAFGANVNWTEEWTNFLIEEDIRP